MIALDVGDYIQIDETEYRVDHCNTPDHVIIVQSDMPPGYYYASFKSKAELEELYLAGRLRFGRQDKVKGGTAGCFHDWKKYVGLQEIFDYCTRCTAKRTRDWREIKDDKEH